MRVAIYSDVGLRDNLEDEARAVLIKDFFHQDREAALLMMADGAGGHNAGEVASGMAVNRIPSSLAGAIISRLSTDVGAPVKVSVVVDLMVDRLVEANRAVVERAQLSTGQAGMATTVVCGVILDGMFFVAWAGDTRCYLYSRHRLQQLTRDHSEAERLRAAGLLHGVDLRDHPLAHTITRYLGQTKDFSPEVRICRLVPGDVVLMGTDGLTDALTEEEIIRELAFYDAGLMAFEDLPSRLVGASLAAGATDNVTVLCYQYQPDALPLAHEINETLTGAYPAALESVLETI